MRRMFRASLLTLLTAGLLAGASARAAEGPRKRPPLSPEMQKLQRLHRQVYGKLYRMVRKLQSAPEFAEKAAAAKKAREALDAAVMAKLDAAPEHKDIVDAVTAAKAKEAGLRAQLAAAQKQTRAAEAAVRGVSRKLIAGDEKLQALNDASKEARDALSAAAKAKLAENPEAAKLQTDLDKIKAQMDALRKTEREAKKAETVTPTEDD